MPVLSSGRQARSVGGDRVRYLAALYATLTWGALCGVCLGYGIWGHR